MDFLTFILILIIVIIIFVFILLISNKPTNNTPNTYRYNVNELKKMDYSYNLTGNEEKFKDNDGNVIEIETRGEREHDKIYFKVKNKILQVEIM